MQLMRLLLVKASRMLNSGRVHYFLFALVFRLEYIFFLQIGIKNNLSRDADPKPPYLAGAVIFRAALGVAKKISGKKDFYI